MEVENRRLELSPTAGFGLPGGEASAYVSAAYKTLRIRSKDIHNALESCLLVADLRTNLINASMIRVAVLHPDLVVARALQFQLRSTSDLQVVSVAHERQRLLDALQPLDVQAVIVGSEFEGGEAFPICQEIQLYAPKVGVLVYSTAMQSAKAKRMMHRGAMGCVLDDDGPEVLHQATRIIGQGGSFISSLAAFYLLGLRQAFTKGDEPYRPNLSPREKDVMRAILEERTTSEIAELLSISFGTVETHRRNILAKVGVRNTAGLVRSCYEFSLLE